MDNNEKLKERVILLTRLYWTDHIHKIGSDLGINEIKNVESYWDLNYFKAVSLVAKSLDDKKLQEIIGNYPTKYVEFGGFYGQYYTLDESLHLSFKNSWPKVRKNVKVALEKWGEKAYGVLTALINKGGSSSYFEIIDEVSKVLGYEYVPSYLLPRLSPLRLVFKSGSNKYPRWIIPTEIIPAVKEELKLFSKSKSEKKKSTKEKQKNENSLLLIERTLDNLVENIVDRKREINLIYTNKFGTKFFIDNEKAIMSIKKPCSNEEEFDNRIQSLSSIIDNIESDKIKEKLDIPNKKRLGTKALMNKSIMNSRDEHFESIHMLKKLRNKKFPTHVDDGEFINAMRFFEQNKFPPDWEVLWEKVLEKINQSLKNFRKFLQA